jgi:hypothetical protein
MHWLGSDIRIVGKVGRNTFIVTVQVNYLVAYVETNAPEYSVFFTLKEKLFCNSTHQR